jgi:hypothetical protein
LNPWPPHCQCGALPTALMPRALLLYHVFYKKQAFLKKMLSVSEDSKPKQVNWNTQKRCIISEFTTGIMHLHLSIYACPPALFQSLYRPEHLHDTFLRVLPPDKSGHPPPTVCPTPYPAAWKQWLSAPDRP